MASTDDPSSTTSVQPQRRMIDSYAAFLHNTSFAMLFVAPALIALPPRKLDIYTLALGGSFVVSANYLVKERTGAGLLAQLPTLNRSLPKRAQEVQAQQQQRRLLEDPASGNLKDMSTIEKKAREIWMGGETEGWKERRLQEEQEKLNRGEGYGSMIMDQVREVWGQGEKNAEALEEKDKEILSEKPRNKP